MTTNTKLKVVIDTNLFLSAFIYHGISKIIFDLIRDNKLQLFISEALKLEVTKKILEYYGNEKPSAEISFFLEHRGTFITPNIKVTASRDPKDNFILELAEEAKADYIITRDKDLLELPGKKWKKTKIKKPEDFLPFLRKMNLLKP